MYWQRRLTRLEVGIYACVASVAIAVFLEHLLQHMELAERTSMEVTISRVNSRIHLARAYAILKGEHAADAPQQTNPFELSGVTPPNFLGTVDIVELKSVERGSWLFNKATGEVIYLPRLHRGLRTEDPDSAIRFSWALAAGGMHMLVPTPQYAWD